MKRYKVWTDSESHIDFPIVEFDDVDNAANYASSAVHMHDDKPYRAILHVEDNAIEETIDTYENIMAE